jgi:hypothetical protein
MQGYSYLTYRDMLNWRMGIDTPTAYSDIWVALSTTAWSADGTGGSEPSAGGYSRRNATGEGFWDAAIEEGSAPSDTIVKNNASITFPIATASWGTITDFALFGNQSAIDPSGGVLICSGPLTTPKEITIDTIAVFLSEGIQIKLTNTAD